MKKKEELPACPVTTTVQLTGINQREAYAAAQVDRHRR